MNNTTLVIMIVIVVVVLALVGTAAYSMVQKRRSQRLRDQFGPEYERSVEQADNRKTAEADLRDREKRHRKLELRTLDADQHRQFQRRWADVQRSFVDDPSRAVRDADGLVIDVMSARGYPVDDFDQRAEDLSVQYPVVTQHYREARHIARVNERGEADTEELRLAVSSYRSLVDALLDDTDASERSRDNNSRTTENSRTAEKETRA
jgi:hypothetical protein